MPFESKSQWRKCWAMKRRGEAGSWNCKEWADSTKKPFKKLPESKPAAEKEAFDNMVRVKTALYKLQSIFEKAAVGGSTQKVQPLGQVAAAPSRAQLLNKTYAYGIGPAGKKIEEHLASPPPSVPDAYVPPATGPQPELLAKPGRRGGTIAPQVPITLAGLQVGTYAPRGPGNKLINSSGENKKVNPNNWYENKWNLDWPVSKGHAIQ